MNFNHSDNIILNKIFRISFFQLFKNVLRFNSHHGLIIIIGLISLFASDVRTITSLLLSPVMLFSVFSVSQGENEGEFVCRKFKNKSYRFLWWPVLLVFFVMIDVCDSQTACKTNVLLNENCTCGSDTCNFNNSHYCSKSGECLFCPTGFSQSSGSESESVMIENRRQLNHITCIETCEINSQTTDECTCGEGTCKKYQHCISVETTGTMKCSSCPKYHEMSGNSQCTQCQSGYYFTFPSDVNCMECPAGRYDDEQGQTEVCKKCAQGRSLITTGESSESDCKICVAGKYGPHDGATSCVTCESAKSQGETTCEGCPPGKYVESMTGDNYTCQNFTYTCQNCTLGMYNSQQNADTCIGCPEGYHADNERKNHKCDACTRGYFGDVRNATSFEDGCKSCSKGQFLDDEGLESCKDCPEGRYGDETALQKESSCKNCGAGKYGSTGSKANSSADCIDCAAGTYNNQVGQYGVNKCKTCPEGFHQDVKGQAFCLPCVPGKRMYIIIFSIFFFYLKLLTKCMNTPMKFQVLMQKRKVFQHVRNVK
jgi:hypothetical protein